MSAPLFMEWQHAQQAVKNVVGICWRMQPCNSRTSFGYLAGMIRTNQSSWLADMGPKSPPQAQSAGRTCYRAADALASLAAQSLLGRLVTCCC
jgi:hypothetical protein